MLSLETCDQANEEFEKIQSEEEDDQEDTSTYEIITYGADYTLSVLYDKMEKGEILTPGFQRRFVWNLNQASKIIISFHTFYQKLKSTLNIYLSIRKKSIRKST